VARSATRRRVDAATNIADDTSPRARARRIATHELVASSPSARARSVVDDDETEHATTCIIATMMAS
jgi:hypothetical protein